jgi:REP-associated tyrosine transposase
MSSPIVIAHHLIWTLYGWWLPNDLRGSTSTEVRCPWIRELSELHFGRKKIQPASRDIRAFYDEALVALKHPLLELSSEAIDLVASGFADAISQFKYTCYACAILRDHVHLIVRKHKHSAEEMIAKLQEFSRLRLSAAGLRSPDHPTWVKGGGKSFLIIRTRCEGRSSTSRTIRCLTVFRSSAGDL